MKGPRSGSGDEIHPCIRDRWLWQMRLIVLITVSLHRRAALHRSRAGERCSFVFSEYGCAARAGAAGMLAEPPSSIDR